MRKKRAARIKCDIPELGLKKRDRREVVGHVRDGPDGEILKVWVILKREKRAGTGDTVISSIGALFKGQYEFVR